MAGKHVLFNISALTLAVLSALLLTTACPLQAQTETVLHFFAGKPDGSESLSGLTSDGAGNFYGTTYQGGLGFGTVFKVSPNGGGGWNETVLYSFTGGADGADPFYSGVILDSMGNIYGTTYDGGVNGNGVVFELSPVGANWTERVLYSFANNGDGAKPVEGLIMDGAGHLYGTAWNYSGGATSVFELVPSGGIWTEHLIYTFPSGNPSGLTMDAAGNIFGTGDREVFELSPDGHGGWNPTVLYSFLNQYPLGTLTFDRAGNLYGMETHGSFKPHGAVYKLSLITKGKNKGKWKKTTLSSFASFSLAGVVLDAAGNIYGTTFGNGVYDAGTVFELVPPVSKGKYTQKILWSFDGAHGGSPEAPLILDSAGNLYGTTAGGGVGGGGVVFELTP